MKPSDLVASLVLVPFAVVLVAACTSDPGRSAADDSFALPSAGTKSVAPLMGRTVEGTLVFDDIEGGCSYLQLADGTKVEVLYPDGWTLDRPGAVLRGPAGVVVEAGATVRATGTVVTDRSSVCQVGPILQATAVERGG